MQSTFINRASLILAGKAVWYWVSKKHILPATDSLNSENMQHRKERTIQKEQICRQLYGALKFGPPLWRWGKFSVWYNSESIFMSRHGDLLQKGGPEALEHL